MGKEAVRRPLAHPRCCQQLSRDLTSLLVSLSLTRGPGTRAGVCPQARPAPDCRTVLCIGWGTAPKSKQLSTEVAICFCSEIWAFFRKTSPDALDGTWACPCIWAVLLQPSALNAALHTAAAVTLVGSVILLPQCGIPHRAWGHSLLPFLHLHLHLHLLQVSPALLLSHLLSLSNQRADTEYHGCISS